MIRWIWELICANKTGIILTLVSEAIIWLITVVIKSIIYLPQKQLEKLLKEDSFNKRAAGEDIAKHLKVERTMKRNFPDYSDYILIQYGSSVEISADRPNDYDFIVLMIGAPKEGVRALHNKGTDGYDIATNDNKLDVDIVFRDYLSFLYASTAGMPYECSVIASGKVIKGNEGYFQWLKNITKNHLYDRDFLVRRFRDKIVIEKQEYEKCLKENTKYEQDKYYTIRAGYYYVTSMLQLNRIKKFNKVFFFNDVVDLSKVRNFNVDINDSHIKALYTKLVDCLKRRTSMEEISIEEIQELLSAVGNEA